MNASALRNKPSMVTALAAILLSSSACAGPLLCEEVDLQSRCPDSDGYYIKAKHQIDHLFGPERPWIKSTLSDDWNRFGVKIKFAKEADERLLQLHGEDAVRSVPEPGSLLLLGIGLVGVALSRRLRWRRGRCGRFMTHPQAELRDDEKRNQGTGWT